MRKKRRESEGEKKGRRYEGEGKKIGRIEKNGEIERKRQTTERHGRTNKTCGYLEVCPLFRGFLSHLGRNYFSAPLVLI
jgi:hypothetical protein